MAANVVLKMEAAARALQARTARPNNWLESGREAR
jgi:hypothetical protein